MRFAQVDRIRTKAESYRTTQNHTPADPYKYRDGGRFVFSGKRAVTAGNWRPKYILKKNKEVVDSRAYSYKVFNPDSDHGH